MPTKHLQVRSEDEDYRRLTEEKDKREVDSLQSAVLEAIRTWSGHSNSPFGTLTKSEEHYLAAVLRYVREDRGVLMAALDELVRRDKAR
jgi:hypothetical protein